MAHAGSPSPQDITPHPLTLSRPLLPSLFSSSSLLLFSPISLSSASFTILPTPLNRSSTLIPSFALVSKCSAPALPANASPSLRGTSRCSARSHFVATTASSAPRGKGSSEERKDASTEKEGRQVTS